MPWQPLPRLPRRRWTGAYAARAGTEHWQKDLLGDDILPPANSAIVEIDDGTSCQFDLKAIFDDGAAVIRREVNSCVTERYTISSR